MGTDLDRIKLKYLGGGSLHGVPARNLTEAETGQYNTAALVASGLYAFTGKSEDQPGPEEAVEIKEANNDRRVKKIK